MSTATALPFRVTTTGPVALACRYELSRALTSATDAIFITPPLHLREIGDPDPSRQWPECEPASALHLLGRKRESGCPARTGAPSALPGQWDARAAFGCGSQ